MAEGIKVPHITLSVDKGGKAYDTRYLKFYDIEPFVRKVYLAAYPERDS